MTAPQQPARQSPGTWPPSRVVRAIAFACLFIAALTAAGSGIDIGPMWAWGFGGFASWALAAVIP